MKPLKLEMNCFAAFYNKTIIDFTNLNKEGIYLVTGDTGAGKTTIFDAMTFALYGEASGEVRKKDGFRSDFAKKEDKTYVIFTFEHAGVTYTVERTPDYMVEGRSTPVAATAHLSSSEGLVVEKTKAVNQKIEEIIKLNINQFRQIIMLAQGEFMKLILSDSKDRDEIFRKIFDTVFLKEMTDKLIIKAKQEAFALNNLDVNLNHSLNDLHKYYEFDLDSYSTNKGEIPSLIDNIENINKDNKREYNLLNKEYKEKNQKLIDLSNLISTSKLINESLDNLEKEYSLKETLDKQKDDINLLKNKLDILNKIQTVKKDYDEIKSLEKQISNLDLKISNETNSLTELKDECIVYDEQVNMIEIDRAALVKMGEFIETLKGYIKTFEELEILDNELESNNKKYNSIKDLSNKLNLEYDELVTKINHLKDEKVNLTKLESDLKVFEKEVKELEKTYKEIKNYHKANKEYQKLKSDLEIAVKSYNIVLSEYNQFNNDYLLAEQSYYNSLVSNLASKLVENNPCPVCGSIHHPDPAKFSNEVVSENELDEKKIKLDIAEKNKENVTIEMERIKTSIKNKEDYLFEVLNINDKNIITETIENLEDDYNSKIIFCKEKSVKTAEEFDSLKKQIDELPVLEESLKTLEKKLDNSKADLKKLEKEITAIETNRKNCLNILGDIESKKDVEEALDNYQDDYNERAENLKLFDDDYAKLKDEIGKVEAVIKSIEETKDDNNKKLEKCTLDYLAKLQKLDLPKEVTNNLDDYFNELAKISNIQKEVTTYEQQVSNNLEKINTLEETTKGKVKNDLDSLDKEKDYLKVIVEELNIKVNNINNLYNQTSTLIDSIKNEFELWDKQSIICNDLNILKDTANGQNAKRISFERYILTEYFENILVYANLRLRRMSDGRYELKRKIIPAKGSSQQGLDMVIFDAETGKERDVKTLSGGETFKAALSLALGLADAIESSVGGIEIDALFIDEGFGTLDDQSLRSAMEILNELRGDQKTIGIISHVQALSDLIPAKLKVKKGNVGSYIQIDI